VGDSWEPHGLGEDSGGRIYYGETTVVVDNLRGREIFVGEDANVFVTDVMCCRKKKEEKKLLAAYGFFIIIVITTASLLLLHTHRFHYDGRFGLDGKSSCADNRCS
jgi:hypothetical protein